MTVDELPQTFFEPFAVELPGRPYMAVKIKRVGFDFPAEPVSIEYPGTLIKEKAVVRLTHKRNHPIFYTLDGSTPTVNSTRYSKPIVITGDNTVLRAFSQTADGKKSPIVSRTFVKAKPKPAIKASGLMPGLLCRAYEGRWQSLPDFETLTPVKEFVAQTIDCGPYQGGDGFGLVFDGYLMVPKDDIYFFFLRSDDGSRLIIDGETLIDNDGLHAPETRSGEIALAKGLHKIRILFFENDGGEVISLHWQTDSMPKTPVPPSALLH